MYVEQRYKVMPNLFGLCMMICGEFAELELERRGLLFRRILPCGEVSRLLDADDVEIRRPKRGGGDVNERDSDPLECWAYGELYVA